MKWYVSFLFEIFTSNLSLSLSLFNCHSLYSHLHALSLFLCLTQPLKNSLPLTQYLGKTSCLFLTICRLLISQITIKNLLKFLIILTVSTRLSRMFLSVDSTECGSEFLKAITPSMLSAPFRATISLSLKSEEIFRLYVFKAVKIRLY